MFGRVRVGVKTGEIYSALYLYEHSRGRVGAGRFFKVAVPITKCPASTRPREYEHKY